MMPHRNRTFFDEGWMAWTNGARLADNPYEFVPGADEAYDAWKDGWHAGCEDYDGRDKEADRADWEYEKWRDE